MEPRPLRPPRACQFAAGCPERNLGRRQFDDAVNAEVAKSGLVAAPSGDDLLLLVKEELHGPDGTPAALPRFVFVAEIQRFLLTQCFANYSQVGCKVPVRFDEARPQPDAFDAFGPARPGGAAAAIFAIALLAASDKAASG